MRELVPVSVADYEDRFPGDTTTGRIISLAQADLGEWLKSTVYTTDALGHPADPDVRLDMIAAVCEQARAHALAAESTATANQASPLGRPLGGASIDGVAWQASGESGIESGYRAPEGGLCAYAAAQLRYLPRRVYLRG